MGDIDQAPETPELDRQLAVIKEGHSNAIGEFLDWLQQQGVWLASYVKYEDIHDQMLAPIGKPINELLAEYYKIDLSKIEEERMALLEYIRRTNERQQS